MKTRSIIATAALAAASIGSVVGLSACGGGGPQSATQILQSNGYTPISLSSLGVTNPLSGIPGGDVSSSALGVSSSNSSEYQFVIVASPQGQSVINSTGDVQNEESQVNATGATLTYSGGVITLTGTGAEFNQLPSGS